MAYQSINPYTGQTEVRFDDIAPAELDRVLKASATAFSLWKKTSFEDRARVLSRAGDILTQRQEELARLATTEMGKHLREARSEVAKCAALCHFYAGNAAQFLADQPVETDPGARSFVAFEPLGTVLAIMPWNFPYWQVFRFAVPALMAGNCGVLKHAGNVPRCALAIEEVFHQAGLPPECFRTLLLPSGRMEEAIGHPAIVAITLTGSEGAGSSAAALAGKHLKKQVLELGGSDPFIVLDDVKDLDEVVKKAVAARMINTGQSCIAAKRFLVHRRIAHAFIEKFVAGMQALTFGDPMDEAYNYGPLARVDLAEDLEKKVQEAVKGGARLLCGGRKGEGAFFQATVLDEVRPGNPAFEEEFFGPVASISIGDNDEDLVRLANASPYGLGSSVWSGSEERAMAIARQLEAGSVFLNEIMKSDQRMPFGGVKRSGYGRELSAFGIREFVNVKTIWAGKSGGLAGG